MLERLIIALSFVLVVASALAAEDQIIRPDPKLTPGAVLTTDAAQVCSPGYAKSVRHTSGRLKHEVYVAYGVDPRTGRYEIDHLISLGLGGADVRENLWPESFDARPWNARAKDRLEDRMRALVCAGRLPLEQAQHEIATDWIAAYRNYLGEPAADR